MMNGFDAGQTLVVPLGSAVNGVGPDYAIVCLLATDLSKLLVLNPVELSQETAGDSGPGHEPNVVPTRVLQPAA